MRKVSNLSKMKSQLADGKRAENSLRIAHWMTINKSNRIQVNTTQTCQGAPRIVVDKDLKRRSLQEQKSQDLRKNSHKNTQNINLKVRHPELPTSPRELESTAENRSPKARIRTQTTKHGQKTYPLDKPIRSR